MMSEKEKEKEMEEEEEVVLHYWGHEHPLTILDETSTKRYCIACSEDFNRGEQRYGCNKKCWFEYAFHRECAEMPMEIRHPMHPQHTLTQKLIEDDSSCGVCERDIQWFWRYFCTSPECFFAVHIQCGQDMGVTTDSDDHDEQGRMMIRHESHPRHKLRWLSRSCSFKCDACGTTHRGSSSYACRLCQYWINERCASLEDTMKREDHPHPLSLSFRVPYEYIIDKLNCDVCDKQLVPRYWVYHCRDCRYVVHVKCAFKKKPDYTKINYGEDIIRFPMAMNDVAGNLIRPFIMRQGGTIPPIPNEDETVNAKYKFRSHEHQLSLISTSNEEKDNTSDDDDDGKMSELICDGCITPILKKNDQTSSDSTDKCYYMSCSECKYFLHYECFHLPSHLPSLPLFRFDRPLVLQSSAKPAGYELCCFVCRLHSNGLFYTYKGEYFKVDIKCASLPDTIYHAAHPQHLLKLVNMYTSDIDFSCASGYGENEEYGYVCYDCEFIVYMKQLLLPTSTKSHKWDKKHPLMLTLDARQNHPDEFYCDECETKMHPKMWMYNCRGCDLCFHPNCFPAASGKYKNIKFGKKYVNEALHPHPLTHQLLTTKRRCDECRRDSYNKRGFHCASCNFFSCFKCVVRKMSKFELLLNDILDGYFLDF